MQKNIYSVSLTIYNQSNAYQEVSELLHNYRENIQFRVGYPMKEKNIAMIFLVIELTNDAIGAFTGKIGQNKSVKVKSQIIKL